MSNAALSYFFNFVLKINKTRYTMDAPQSSEVDDTSSFQHYYDAWPRWQIITIVWTQRTSAMTSIIGSSYIIYKVLGVRRKEQLQMFYQRLMLSLSISDIVGSSALYAASLPLPKDNMQSFAYGNYGNTATCDAQGFMLHVSSL